MKKLLLLLLLPLCLIGCNDNGSPSGPLGNVPDGVTQVDYDINNDISNMYGDAKKSVVTIYEDDPVVLATSTGFIYEIKEGKAYVVTVVSVFSNIAVNDFYALGHDDDTDLLLEATLHAHSKRLNIAIFVVDVPTGADWTVVDIAEDKEFVVGEELYAIGTVYDIYRNCLYATTISGLDRGVGSGDYSYIAHQITLGINDGYLGAPLFTKEGKFVGFVSWTITGNFESMSFFSPIYDYQHAIEELITNQSFTVMLMGVTTTPPEVKNGQIGMEITAVEADSAAERANIVAGTFLLTVEGNPLLTRAVLLRAIFSKNAGDTLSFTALVPGNSTVQNLTITF